MPSMFYHDPQQPSSISQAWQSGQGYEGYDRFQLRLSKFKVRRTNFHLATTAKQFSLQIALMFARFCLLREGSLTRPTS